jgi:tetratricopeptide (TPR) repeat protein
MRKPLELVALVLGLVAGLVVSPAASGQGPTRPLVPEAFTLDPAARQAIQAAWLTDEERAALRVFHGVWDDRDLGTPTARAAVALNAWRLDDPVFDDESVPAEMRAEARLRRGDVGAAIDVLDGVESLRAARIRAEAHEMLGDQRAAEEAVADPVRRMLDERVEDAAELTEGVRAMMIRARLQGQPGRDYQTMVGLLGRAHQQLDRLHWPATLAEAELLLDKDNEDDAVDALHETLALNPRCAEAWYRLGTIALDRFDFDSARGAAEALQRLDGDHPLASLLLAESRLIQDDPEEALEILAAVVERWPRQRPAHALVAAAHAVHYEDDEMREALDRSERLSPGSAYAYWVVGKHLSFNRQYGAAAEMLEEAVRRQPAWPAPQIELGLMELQSGRDDRALAVLQDVARLDPFNKRAANSLFLLEELAGYNRVESEHFVVRYRPGIDQVMVDMMLDPLERIHATVSERFEWEPPRKTVIELMPDHKRFAVRITGMPFIHTIAACTGPVIAMEVPREGNRKEHLGA